VKKFLLVMKITTLLLIVSIMQVSAITFAQKITYTQKSVTVEQLFREITKQTGYNILYADREINTNRKLDVNFNQTPLDDVLKQTSKGMSIAYKIEGKNIIILTEDTPSFLDRVINRFVDIDVNGKIIDINGNPITGATVTVKGTKKSAITSSNGAFLLKNIDQGAILVISFVGYITKEVQANTVMAVILEQSESKLDEVQVIAYGTTTRRLSTSSISSVKAEDIQKQPVSNPLLALQGRVPGLIITQQNGVPGGAVNVQIRGKNSMQSGTDPLYVVDGMPFNAKMLTPLGSIYGDSSPFSYLNPDDIESIDVLKDADATSIYGSRAANGAILITTKKGKAGKTQVGFNLQNGWGKVPRQIDLLNTREYLNLRREAIKNDNAVISPTDYDVNGVWDTTRNTNWQKELLGGTSKFENTKVSISGGTLETQFLVGAGYRRETTVFPDNFSDKKGSVNFSINHKSPNHKFQFQFSGNFLYGVSKLPNVDLTSYALRLPPNAPALYNADGSINWQLLPDGNSSYDNPARVLELKYQNKTTNLIGNSIISYEVFPGLRLKGSFGYNKISSDEKNRTPITYWEPNGFYKVRIGNYSTKSNAGYIVEPQIEYGKVGALGQINILLGSTFQQNTSDLVGFNAIGFNSDAEIDNIARASTVTVSNSIQSVYKYNAIFGRVNYNYKDKYILNINARRDGSSRFGSENQFHNFYSIGGAWIFTEDDFIKENIPYLNFGKLSASYGSSGNDQIGDYKYLNLFSPVTSGITVPYQGIIGSAPNGHTNPFLQWEATEKLNIGLNLGVLSNRILLGLNYYKNNSSNQLLYNPLPVQTGFSYIQENFPAKIQNSGWEIELITQPVKNKKLLWRSSINFTTAKNRLLSFQDLENNPYVDNLFIGQPITIVKTYKYAGVNQQTGIYEFINSKGEVTSNPNPTTDKFVLINTDPKFYGGWQNNFSYLGFGLDFLFSFTKQTGNNSFSRFGSGLVGYVNNQPVSVLDRWKVPGNTTKIQKSNANFDLSNSSDYANNSDAAYSDVSFINLKNVSISYTFSKELISKLKLTQASVFVQGQNLFIITPYKGLNPEYSIGNNNSIPPLRVITLGLNINL